MNTLVALVASGEADAGIGVVKILFGLIMLGFGIATLWSALKPSPPKPPKDGEV